MKNHDFSVLDNLFLNFCHCSS